MTKLTQKFAIEGNKVFPYIEQAGSVVEQVPPAFYHIDQHPLTGQYFLVNKAPKLPVPTELYGSTENRANLIMNTYNRKPVQLGVALFGQKGAGKTLLSNVVANKAIEQGLPVIEISNSFNDSAEYLDFINSIGNCVIIFDEFLKVLKNKARGDGDSSEYRATERGQEKMLTFFSGSNNAKRLTILIDNEQHALNDYFLNRPSRLRYIFQYDSVEPAVIQALADKVNLPESLTEELITYSTKYSCTFDMINELIDELVTIGRYDDVKLSDVTQYFNTPSIREVKPHKFRVAEFGYRHQKDEDPLAEDFKPMFKLTNEVAIKLNKAAHVSLMRLCPWHNDEVVYSTEEEFKKAWEGESWDTYQKSLENEGYAPYSIGVDYSHLQSMKGDSSTYRTGMFTVTLVDDIEEPEPTNFYDVY